MQTCAKEQAGASGRPEASVIFGKELWVERLVVLGKGEAQTGKPVWAVSFSLWAETQG